MKINKNKLWLPILCVIILAILYIDNKFIFHKIIAKNQFTKEMVQLAELNKNNIFKISKIIKYSSAEAIDNTAEQNLQDVSIHQYSDMAFYIDNGNGELTEENTIKELYLDNFNIDVNYKYGIPSIYYKNPLDISKFRMIDDNKINDILKYDIIYTNKENENNKYEKPTFFADCSNPITLSYINQNIINHYQVTKNNGLISFDGRIFKNIDVDLEKLSPKISFTVHLKNNLDEEFVCDVSAKMNLENDEGTVKSGYIIQIEEDIGYYKFIRKI